MFLKTEKDLPFDGITAGFSGLDAGCGNLFCIHQHAI